MAKMTRAYDYRVRATESIVKNGKNRAGQAQCVTDRPILYRA